MTFRMAVVIPASNEQARVGACITAVADAIEEVVTARTQAPVLVVVAADSCTDRTVECVQEAWDVHTPVIGARAHLRVISGYWACAGGARRAAALAALTARPQWIASTDADTRVPPDWLTYHLERAGAGVDAVLGTVEPDPSECPEYIRQRWHRHHRLEEGHPYIHAANMGVRMGPYKRAGGFPAVKRGEDEEVVRALRARGARVESTDRIRAITSARLRGRAELGFAYHLRELAQQGTALDGLAER